MKFRRFISLVGISLTFLMLSSAAMPICTAAAADTGMSFTANTVYSPVNTMTTAIRTFEATVYFPSSQTGRGGVILSNYRTDSDKYISFEIHENGVPRICGRTDNSGNANTNPSIPFDIKFTGVNVYKGKPVHVAITLEKASAKCYIDGQLAQTLAYSSLNISAGVPFVKPDRPLRLGGDARTGNAQYFKGNILNVAVYSDIRTAVEIYDDMTEYGTDGLLMQYDTPSASSAPERIEDKSGNGFDMINTVRWISPSDKAPVSDYDYTFAVVGDTQNINYLYPDDYGKIYDWIVANKDEKNIQYVLGLGDITEKPANTDEWARAQTQIGKLDTAGIPYSLAIGNDTHDTSAKFNAAFNKSPYKDSIGGLYKNTEIENSWRKIEVGTNKIKYLIFTLDWLVTDEELQWASDVIAANPDYNVIITTHAYLYRDGTTFDKNDLWGPTYGGYHPDANDGDRIWEKLIKKHENIVLVMSGHDPTEQIVMTQTKGDNGNVVTQLLIDPQDIDKAEQSAGMVALLHFSADGRTVEVEYYSTVKEKYFLNTNQFTFQMDTSHEHSYGAGYTSFGEEGHAIVCDVEGCDEHGEIAAHSGGTATCMAKAKCEVCGAEYGELGGHTYGDDNKCACGAENPNPTDTSSSADSGKKGCKSSVIGASVAITATAAGAAIATKKRKED